MDKSVKTGILAAGVFGLLAWWGSTASAASVLRVEDVADMTSAKQVVKLREGGSGPTVNQWIASMVAQGYVVLAGPGGVNAGAYLFAVEKSKAKEATQNGFFRIIGGSAS